MTSIEICAQATTAMDILNEHYPAEDHVFIYDNATTHLKRADDALSACHMPKNSPKHRSGWDGVNWGEPRKPFNWGIETNVLDTVGKPVYGSNGEIMKKKVPMCNATFQDGSPQSLYYEAGHELAGVFKGMVVILEE